MPFGLDSAARIHRDTFFSLIAEIGQNVEVRQPAANPVGGNDVTKALGTRTQAVGVGPSVTVKAIVSGATTSSSYPTSSPVPQHLAPVGLLQTADVVLRVKLADALLDEDKVFGKTIFETAKDVLIGGQSFKVTVVDRTGLAPLGPYILWVGLEYQGR